jgi:hypothetical protein
MLLNACQTRLIAGREEASKWAGFSYHLHSEGVWVIINTYEWGTYNWKAGGNLEVATRMRFFEISSNIHAMRV